MKWKGQPYFFRLIGKDVDKNRSQFRRSPNAMKKIFAQFFELDNRCVEFNSCVRVDEGGLEYGFTIFSEDNKLPNIRVKRLLKIHNSVCKDDDHMFIVSIVLECGLSKQCDINVSSITTF